MKNSRRGGLGLLGGLLSAGVLIGVFKMIKNKKAPHHSLYKETEGEKQ